MAAVYSPGLMPTNSTFRFGATISAIVLSRASRRSCAVGRRCSFAIRAMLQSTAMATKLRPATNSDREVVTQLVFTVLREYGLQPNNKTTDADLSDIEANYAQRGGAFDVLENAEGAIIGCVGLYPTDSKTCELRKMYLQKSVR